jgi:hypothetical protein
VSTKAESYLSHLYVSEQYQAYEIVLGLVNEVEDLKKQLAEAKSLTPEPHLVTLKDFELMVSMASQEYVKRAFPIKLSGKQVSYGQEPHFFLIEAFVSHLNRYEILKKPVVFDYRK